jgi:hypothetical protein
MRIVLAYFVVFMVLVGVVQYYQLASDTLQVTQPHIVLLHLLVVDHDAVPFHEASLANQPVASEFGHFPNPAFSLQL